MTEDLVAAAKVVSPPRGRKGKLDLGAVAEAALALIDSEGLGALTMRRLASDLDVSLTTLYAAAEGKEQVLRAVVELVVAQIPDPPVDGRWQDSITALYLGLHHALVAHPAAARLATLTTSGTHGDSDVKRRTLAVLNDDAGLDADAAFRAYKALRSYVTGATLLRVSRGAPSDELDDTDFHAGLSLILTGIEAELPGVTR